MVKTTIMISEELHRRIKEYGFKNNKSLGWIIRESVENFLGPIHRDVKKDIPSISAKPLSEKSFVHSRGELDPNDYL